MTRIAIFYPTDPFGFVPSGIDSFIRGILKWSPADLDYTLFGATTNPAVRPIGKEIVIPGVNRSSRFIPLVAVDPLARRSRIPLTVRYMWALGKYIGHQSLTSLDILDFHRLEPVLLFRGDRRPKNLVLHQDMSVIRGASSDIMWRHLPWLYERLENYLFRFIEHVFCVRQSAVERYRETYGSRGPEFEFIPTWVDVETFAPISDAAARGDLRERMRAELNIPTNALLLTFVGRFDRQKDPMLLIDAFIAARARMPSLHLVLIGDGALRAQVEERIQVSDIAQHVSMPGVLPSRRIAEVLRASDLFVLSSAYEGMPIAVLEALATGLPVVTTDVGEIRLVVTDGVNGAISKDRTSAAFAEAIMSALARLESLRGSPCSRAIRQYGPESVLSRIHQLHRQQAGTGAGETS